MDCTAFLAIGFGLPFSEVALDVSFIGGDGATVFPPRNKKAGCAQRSGFVSSIEGRCKRFLLK
jgi:hypothetical protein